MTMGIYRIDGPKNRVYIGSSVNIESRWSTHKAYLKRNHHHSALLQCSWNKYGEEAHKFSIEKMVENVDDLIYEEQKMLDFIFVALEKDRIYNTNRYADSRLGTRHSKKARENISKTKTGKKLAPLTEEHKANISNANKGRTFTEEHKANISNANKGRTFTEEYKKQRALSSSGGKVYTIGHKDGRIFYNVVNLHQFSREYNVDRRNLCQAVNGKLKQTKGFYLIKIDYLEVYRK